MKTIKTAPSIAVIGGGPAGLMAAEVLVQGGMQVDVYDAMPSVARKFLLAGIGGLNITHAEPHEVFITRYGARSEDMKPLLHAFGPQALRDFVHGLGMDTFVGTSNRVFPTGMKAAPLLRAWLHRLREAGVRFHVRHRWLGWEPESKCEPKKRQAGHRLLFATPDGERTVHADAIVMAMGGGSFAHLGSDGAWVPLLQSYGVSVAPLQPSNCGFEVNDTGWTEHFRKRFAGSPVKPVIVTYTDGDGVVQQKQGEFVVTETGVEGSLIYALSAILRDKISEMGEVTLYLDLVPGLSLKRLTDEIARPRGARSMSSHLQSRANIKGVKMALLRELLGKEDFADRGCRLASLIKALPLRLTAPCALSSAISSAGGVTFEVLNAKLMLHALPGVFCAGEMLDWEAPTGGYLLTGCFASGRAAGMGALEWLNNEED